MSKRILITGGAGFLGSHLAGELLAQGHVVRALDNLAPRVHVGGRRPSYLDRDVELIVGDVRDGAVVERALTDIDVVFHFAAAVGAGESLFEVERCMSVNNVGTAVLLDRIARSSVERVILGSSAAIYGEGMYRDANDAIVEIARRRPEQLRRGEWNPTSEGVPLTPVATPESKSPAIEGAVYAGSKFDQERMCFRAGRKFGIDTVALRFFNVVGGRQSLCNPYTGDLARFASRLLAGRRPRVAEDGGQLRDYIDVRDAVRACRLAMSAELRHSVVNVGSGVPTSQTDIARQLATIAGAAALAPEVTGKYQLGDVRHCFADASRARDTLCFQAEGSLAQGLANLLESVASQTHAPLRKAYPRYVQLEMGLAS